MPAAQPLRAVTPADDPFITGIAEVLAKRKDQQRIRQFIAKKLQKGAGEKAEVNQPFSSNPCVTHETFNGHTGVASRDENRYDDCHDLYVIIIQPIAILQIGELGRYALLTSLSEYMH